MKYHNFKRIFAGFLAAVLAFSTAVFTVSAEETSSDVTYLLSGEKGQNGAYVLNISAQGGLINVGAVEIDFSTEVFEDVTVEYAKNIKEADFYMGYDGELRDGTAEISFMSASGISDEEAGLFAENLSNTLAYIDATGDEPVEIATVTFYFADASYDEIFVTGNVNGSPESACISAAKAVLHFENSYDVELIDVEAEITNKLVFSASDFVLENLETVYNGEAQTILVDSDVAEYWTLVLGDSGDENEVTNAGEYSIRLKDVTGFGYYDAAEITFDEKFVIKKADVEIEGPEASYTVDYVPGGYDLSNFEIEGWEVTSEGKLNAGTHTVDVKYAGELDLNNIKYTFGGVDVTSADEITTTVELTVNKIAGTIPPLETDYEAIYDPNVENQWIKNYVDLSDGWVWSNATKELQIGEYKDILVLFIPEDTDNYTYEGLVIEGYNKPCVEGYVNVTLNKAEGTAPDYPTVADSKRLESADDVLNVSDFIADAGKWEYDNETLSVGENEITFTYKPDDTDKYDYSGLNGWNAEAEQFEYTTTVEVLKPYIDFVVSPVNPEAKSFVPNGYKYSDFELEGSWEYATPDTEITGTGSVENVKVLYTVPAEYDIDPESGYIVEDGKIVSYVTLTVRKASVSKDMFTVTDLVHTYDGNVKQATITFSDEYYRDGELLLGEYTVEYFGLGEGHEESKTTFTEPFLANYNYSMSIDFNESDYYEQADFDLELTFQILPRQLTADNFEVIADDFKYDGDVKTPTVNNVDILGDGEIGEITLEYKQGEETVTPINAGTYDVYATVADFGNYKGFTSVKIGSFDINKATFTIDKPENPEAVDYVEGGYDLAGITVEGWKITSTGKVNAGTHTVNIEYAGAMDFNSYEYVFEGEKVTAAPTSTVTLTVNKIALPNDAYTAEKVVAVYDGAAKEITVTDSDNYSGVGTYTVTYSAESVVNVGTYSATITVAEGDNYLAGTITLADIIVIEAANLPADAVSAQVAEFEYDGSEKTVNVVVNTKYNGLGEYTVAYPTGNIDAGTYNVTVNFADGTNYKAGTITLENVLVINKKNVESVVLPEVVTEALVGDEFTGLIGETNWSYAEDYTITEGENTIVAVAVIPADTAKNNDYSAAAEAGDFEISVEDDGSLTFTKVYTVTGIVPAGYISFEALAIDGVSIDDEDVTVMIIPEEGDAIVLEHDSEGHIIFAENYKLDAGKYSISVKKTRYLEAVINFELSHNETIDFGQIELIPGDIVGGPAGSETLGDGVIDIDDFIITLRGFDTESDETVKAASDIDGNGISNVTDLAYIKANFGKTTAADSTYTVESND